MFEYALKHIKLKFKIFSERPYIFRTYLDDQLTDLIILL